MKRLIQICCRLSNFLHPYPWKLWAKLYITLTVSLAFLLKSLDVINHYCIWYPLAMEYDSSLAVRARFYISKAAQLLLSFELQILDWNWEPFEESDFYNCPKWRVCVLWSCEVLIINILYFLYFFAFICGSFGIVGNQQILSNKITVVFIPFHIYGPQEPNWNFSLLYQLYKNRLDIFGLDVVLIYNNMRLYNFWATCKYSFIYRHITSSSRRFFKFVFFNLINQ